MRAYTIVIIIHTYLCAGIRGAPHTIAEQRQKRTVRSNNGIDYIRASFWSSSTVIHYII